MYLAIFLIVFGLLTVYTDKKNEIDTNDEFLYWARKDAIIIGVFLALSIVLSIIPQSFVISLIGGSVFLISLAITALYVNKNREQYIQSYKQQLDQIISAITPLKKVSDVNYSDLPFTITRDGSKINTIRLKMEKPEAFRDDRLTNVVNTFNNCFPYYEWQYACDFQKQVCVFEGKRLPPEIALWNGSDMRPPSFMPIGLSGNGEVGIRLDKEDEGESSYIYEDGVRAETIKLPTAPQHLVVGSPLSLKTIIPTVEGYKELKDITTEDYVFDIYNKPSKVIGISKEHLSKRMFRLDFVNLSNGNSNYILSDHKHNFPKFTNNKVSLCTCSNLSVGDVILGSNKTRWQIKNKTIVENEIVKCIKIESPSHLFLFDNLPSKLWKGGNTYYKALPSTSNTGGGKAIWINQELW